MRIAEVLDPQETPITTGMFVYHGSPGPEQADEDFNSAGFEALLQGRVDLEFAFGGYFGYGFYVTEDAALARSNYASRLGYVFKYQITEARRILDLRRPEHWDKWQRSGLDRIKTDRAMPALAIGQGVDGVYDRSVGGLCIYNPRILKSLGYEGPLK